MGRSGGRGGRLAEGGAAERSPPSCPLHTNLLKEKYVSRLKLVATGHTSHLCSGHAEMTSCKILEPGERREAAMRTMACKHCPLVVRL